MLCKTDSGEEIFIGSFCAAIKVPSGHAGINFVARDGITFTVNTVILDLTFDKFVAEWNRQH